MQHTIPTERMQKVDMAVTKSAYNQHDRPNTYKQKVENSCPTMQNLPRCGYWVRPQSRHISNIKLKLREITVQETKRCSKTEGERCGGEICGRAKEMPTRCDIQQRRWKNWTDKSNII